MSVRYLKILLIGGDDQQADRLADQILQSGHRAIAVETRGMLAAGLERLTAGDIQVLLLDARDLRGAMADAISTIANHTPAVPIIAISSSAEPEQLAGAIRAGAQDVLNATDLSGPSMLRAIHLALARSAADETQANNDQALRESEARIAAIINASLDCIITVDPDGKIQQFNPAAEKTFGYKAQEVIGREMGEFFMPPELRERQRRSFQLFQSAGAGSMLGRRIESPAFRKDGKEFIAEMATQPVSLGGELAFTVFLRDITDRRLAEDALKKEIEHRRAVEETLRRERDLLRALMDHLPDFIFAKDAEGHFVALNAELRKAIGAKADDEVLGQTDYDFFPEELADHYRKDDRKVMKSGRPLVNREETTVTDEGEERWLLTTKVPLRDGDGKVEGLVGIARDITSRKRAEEELERAKAAAEAANRAKSSFLANMSHEIRTPMNAVIGMTELLLDTELTPHQRDYLQMVQESGESLLTLINDILDFSKIEAGKLELEELEFPLHDCLATTMKSLGVRAHRKDIELAYHVAPSVPANLVGDINRLRQVIINLVGNAIKFTDDGEVVLEVESKSKSDGEVVLQFAVRDTGIGITEEQLGRIFEAFEQADASVTRKAGGTGLGLAISSRLVEMMGGRIWVESEFGRGSTFLFTTTFRVGSETPAANIEPPDVAGRRVLIVDDNATNRLILKEMCEKWRLRPTVVAGGDDALAALCEAAGDGQPIDVVISDVNMPEMDGFTLVEAIRQDDRIADTPVIMLTSGDRPGDIARSQQLRIAAHMLKPAGRSELLEAILKALHGVTRVDRTQETAETQSVAVEPLRILLAEDSIVNQRLAIGLLKKHGHTVTVANNGLEAVEASASGEFDVVLMDVQMPELDGLEATAMIRQREEGTDVHLPIIAMTAHAMTGDRDKCIDAGMDDYVAKPIRSAQLYEKLAQYAPGVAKS